MLRQENKRYASYFAVLFVMLFVSCNKYKTYNERDIKEIRERSIEKSQSVISKNEYYNIYETLNDSINDWRIHHLGYYQYLGISKDYLVDSVLCFNTKGDKLITTILRKQLLKEGVQDDIDYFYGVKIENQWYFFGGPTLVLPREYYQEDIHTPLSFEKLKQIATDHIYRGYLRRGKRGRWEINERFFSDLTSVAWCTDCVTQQEWDSVYIKVVQDNWKK